MLIIALIATCCFIVSCVPFLASFISTIWPVWSKRSRPVPKIPRRWPVVGNAFQLSMDKCHLVFTEWSKRYGAVFEVKLFNEKIVVLNDYDSIHEALVQAGTTFAGRPKMHRTDQKQRCKKSIVWQTYTQKLVFLRKEVHKSLKMYGPGLLMLEDVCRPELESMVERIQQLEGEMFDPSRIAFDSVGNVMLYFLLGRRFDPNGEEIETIRAMSKLFNQTFGSGEGKRLDVIPWLRFGQNEETRRLESALSIRDKLWNNLIKQHGTFSENSVIGHLQSLKNENTDMDDDTIKECFTNLILAGVDTTATALTCLILILQHDEELQARIQTEIDGVFPDGAFPSLSKRNQTPLTEAVILELLRYISHVPLAVPHSTLENATIKGYHIDADSTVYINLWALHHDENIWSNPWKFDPSRFLDDNGKLHSPQHPNRKRLLAFGAGRRVCLGEAFARNRLYLFVTVLLQRFAFIPSDSDAVPRDSDAVPGDSGDVPDNSVPHSEDTGIDSAADPRSYDLGLVLHPKPFKVKAIRRKY